MINDIKSSKHKMLYLIFAMIIVAGFISGPILTYNGEARNEFVNMSGSCLLDGQRWTVGKQHFSLGDNTTHVAVVTLISNRFIPKGDTIFIQIRNGDMQLKKNDEIFFSKSSAKGIDGYNMIFGKEWMRAVSPGISENDEISIVLNNVTEDSAATVMNNIYICDGLELLKFKLYENLWQILIALFLCSCGFAHGIIFFSLHKVQKSISRGYISCSVLIISGAISSFIDYDYTTLLVDKVTFFNELDYLLQVIVYLSLLIYLRVFLKNTNEQIVANCFITFVVVCSLLYYTLVFMKVSGSEYFVKSELFCGIIMTILLLLLLYRENRINKVEKVRSVIRSCIIMCLSTIVEIIHFNICSSYWIIVFQIGLSIFTYIQFRILFRDAREKLIIVEETERRLVDSRISIMLSQIQPHFLYNALGVIYNLCDKDPKSAKIATSNFAKYLRLNLDSLKLEAPVPFETELQHIEIYLSLEKMRFEDSLNIVYDIQAKGFLVPALTIQPLVENAVKYGVGKAPNGGTVTISVKELDESYQVTVSDDGVGFDPYEKQDDGRTHIGIDNVKDRLWLMIHATLKIKSEKNIGTTAIITIPKERKVTDEHNSSGR